MLDRTSFPIMYMRRAPKPNDPTPNPYRHASQTLPRLFLSEDYTAKGEDSGILSVKDGDAVSYLLSGEFSLVGSSALEDYASTASHFSRHLCLRIQALIPVLYMSRKRRE
ncbi:hypothetical protein L2E82_18786 [Cichorium intybus]|uniref:Uncharacterized protein n=1 Tax=Cichorium intybus TaxID=13427 RepID=A0ACB9FC92_CICIN|nr:hypothetical protein L2E82_18786 [Cichorium intybus]